MSILPISTARIMNGIGGSGDFAQNAGLSIFMTPSTAKNGTLSCIVPFITPVDHTNTTSIFLVTEYGYADLRATTPKKERARKIIDLRASGFPAYAADYLDRACAQCAHKHASFLAKCSRENKLHLPKIWGQAPYLFIRCKSAFCANTPGCSGTRDTAFPGAVISASVTSPACRDRKVTPATVMRED